MHRQQYPAIFYFGTPVVLVSTLNADGSANLAPMSSIFWLGWRCMVGLAATSKTTENILRSGECVLNLPDDGMAGAVNRLALTTGSDPVPSGKAKRGYVHCADKFARAGLTRDESAIVAPPRVRECPVQLEATLEGAHQMAVRDWPGGAQCLELRVLRAHIHESILLQGEADRVDPDLWRPLIMSFQKFYGLGPQLEPSALAQVPEHMYRTPDHAPA
ncbi:MAG: flavin reductase family protein [Methylobacteriaceae bacterium]|nr:flavin reductase family protein [Methylobacteriaceae bacterium]